jgi:hypothetical protein
MCVQIIHPDYPDLSYLPVHSDHPVHPDMTPPPIHHDHLDNSDHPTTPTGGNFFFDIIISISFFNVISIFSPDFLSACFLFLFLTDLKSGAYFKGQRVAVELLKYHLSPPCFTLLCPAGGHP